MENGQAAAKKPPCSLIRLRAWIVLSMCTQAYLTHECTHVRRGRFLLWVYIRAGGEATRWLCLALQMSGFAKLLSPQVKYME